MQQQSYNQKEAFQRMLERRRAAATDKNKPLRGTNIRFDNNKVSVAGVDDRRKKRSDISVADINMKPDSNYSAAVSASRRLLRKRYHLQVPGGHRGSIKVTNDGITLDF